MEDEKKMEEQIQNKYCDKLFVEEHKVKVCWSPSKGNYMTAKEDLKAGETLFFDTPYAVVISDNLKKYVCNSCCRFLPETNSHNTLVCVGCFQIHYCSMLCKQSKSRECFHYEDECIALSKFTEGMRNSFREDELILIGLSIRVLCRKDFDLKDGDGDQMFETIMSLSDHYSENSDKLKERINLMAVTINCLLPNPPSLESKEIHKLICKIRNNNFGIWTRVENRPSTILWCGAAIYLKCSYFNHSCFPTSIVLQQSDTADKKRYLDYDGIKTEFGFCCKTLCKVTKNSELTLSYIRVTENKEKRDELLFSNWFFHCDCCRCSNSLPHSIFSFCCEFDVDCTGGLLIPFEDDNSRGYCRVCNMQAILPPRIE